MAAMAVLPTGVASMAANTATPAAAVAHFRRRVIAGRRVFRASVFACAGAIAAGLTEGCATFPI
ncbi:hypothetical protein D3C73_1271350 [compost metagenome]